MKRFKEILNKKTLTVDELAKKHKVSVKDIKDQLEMGIAIEKEHTSHESVAKEIALDHIGEKPDYYTRLKKVEK